MQRSFPRDLKALDAIFELTAEFCASAGVNQPVGQVIDLVLEELFTNVLKYSPEGQGDILIELDRSDDVVRMALTDFDADRFDPSEATIPDTEAPLEERTPGGLGLYLIRRMTDDVRYEYRDRVGKIVVTKKLG